MALVPVSTRNRVNPIPVLNIPQHTAPYPIYDQVELCSDPNCPVCRAQRHDRHNKHHKRHHHHHHHHHRKHKSHFWNKFLPRVESADSTVTIHSIELDERRPYYNSYAHERAVVPVYQPEQQVVTTTRPRRIPEDEIVRDAWADNPADDEIVCCRAYNGCRCPCWCCIILIILFVIMIIILIVLLVTLL